MNLHLSFFSPSVLFLVFVNFVMDGSFYKSFKNFTTQFAHPNFVVSFLVSHQTIQASLNFVAAVMGASINFFSRGICLGVTLWFFFEFFWGGSLSASSFWRSLSFSSDKLFLCLLFVWAVKWISVEKTASQNLHGSCFILKLRNVKWDVHNSSTFFLVGWLWKST